ncbi:hypothetical protein [Pseudoalteromonas phenolica]|uniref:Orphan protein n=1 Tax=Pseudoalteromonas phenolica TaxID=161398 RepID=A0A0S2K1W3_9GAMM|nr:hypothetical protein [Pseudoalteromonas phenolica]ALO42201.1 hypothetical protein PP2015_1699 [Pseudoalteromonas phenolica]MBE0356705.1 hypothetical protein [Pseudoalteromonas phenolica O-BC30]RXE94782.1 hypothetical protein D9981_18040 [Pseudoalteromonas phenolica O-BC30]TMO56665.1 hypothetical protein CWC21_05700 [Pseudoalteromonas phenolica]
MSQTFKVIPPTTKVFCHERGEGWTLTGITDINEHTSVMFNGTRYTIPAKKIIEELLPNFEKQIQKN